MESAERAARFVEALNFLAGLRTRETFRESETGSGGEAEFRKAVVSAVDVCRDYLHTAKTIDGIDAQGAREAVAELMAAATNGDDSQLLVDAIAAFMAHMGIPTQKLGEVTRRFSST